MKAALVSQFWNQELESPRAPDAVVTYLAHDPPPLSSLLCSGLSRPQQLLLLQRLLPVPGTPSYVIDDDGGGGWVADRVVAALGTHDWWATVTGRLRLQRFVAKSMRAGKSSSGAASRTAGYSNGDSNGAGRSPRAPGLLSLSSLGEALTDPGLYAMTWNSRLRLGRHTWVSAVGELQTLPCFQWARHRARGQPGPSEQPGDGTHAQDQSPGGWTRFVQRAPLRGRVTFRHKMRKHEVVADASMNRRCVDGHGCWWTAPHAVALDLASLGTWHGLRYRLGLHHVGAEARLDVDARGPVASGGEAVLPQGALPGTRVQAGSSLEGEVVLWKDRCERKRRAAETERQQALQKLERRSLQDRCYNLLASRPRITLSGLLGGIGCIAIKTKPAAPGAEAGQAQSRHVVVTLPRVSAHLFALVGATAQLGLFERPVLDHTLLSAHLHCTTEASPFSLAHPTAPKGLSQGRSGQLVSSLRLAPTVSLTFQQQIFGPIRARYDGRFGLHRVQGRLEAEPLETVLSVDCSLEKLLGAARFVVWYSPTRREGMAELRLLDR